MKQNKYKFLIDDYIDIKEDGYVNELISKLNRYLSIDKDIRFNLEGIGDGIRFNFYTVRQETDVEYLIRLLTDEADERSVLKFLQKKYKNSNI